ncbi:MAG: hypothetical protein F7C81_04950 [Desulfurococcales archaeon]|nr:hypothetical protein [Desulfurococcales archaeon]MEB3779278.1 hypothetical protein [Desulfurococcales archaeon]
MDDGKSNLMLEQRKMTYAVVAALLASTLILLAPVLIATGSSTTLALSLLLIVAIFLVGAFIMDLTWDSWGLRFGAILTVLVTAWMIFNLSFGR